MKKSGKNKITKEEEEVIDILREKLFLPNGEVDVPLVFGISVTLRRVDETKNMLKWLKEHPEADRDEIVEAWEDLAYED